MVCALLETCKGIRRKDAMLEYSRRESPFGKVCKLFVIGMFAVSLVAKTAAQTARPALSVHLDLKMMEGKPLEDYLSEVRRTGASSVQLALCEFYEEGEHRRLTLAQLKETIAFFEKAGYDVRVWITTFGYGHADSPEHKRVLRRLGLTRLTGFDGRAGSPKLRAGLCAADPKVLDWISRTVEDIARAGARTILLDDEFVQSRRENYYCFCPRHLALMSEKVGRPVSAADVRKSLTGAPNPVRRAYLDAMGESLLGAARAIRAAADAVDPEIRIGLCPSFNSYDCDGGDIDTLVRLLAGRRRPLMRLSGATYWMNCIWGSHYPGQELGGVAEFFRMQLGWYAGKGYEIMDENDPYPRLSETIDTRLVELYDALSIASGVEVRNKYILRELPEEDRAYREAHAARIGEHAHVAATFAGRVACGWRVFAPEHLVRDAYLPDELPEARRHTFVYSHPLAGIFLGLSGETTTYDLRADGPVAVFGEAAAKLPADLMSAGVLTDRGGARALARTGVVFGQPIGTDGPFSLFRDERGRRFAVVDWQEDFSRRADHPLFASESFRDALERTHSELCGRPPYVSVRGAHEIYAYAAKGPDGSLAVMLCNVQPNATADFKVKLSGREMTVSGLAPHTYHILPKCAVD